MAFAECRCGLEYESGMRTSWSERSRCDVGLGPARSCGMELGRGGTVEKHDSNPEKKHDSFDFSIGFY